MTGARSLPALALPLLLAACGQASPPVGGSTSPTATTTAFALQGEDAVAYQRWLDAGIADYRFSVQAQCFCPQVDPAVVTVRDGAVVSVEPSGSFVWPEVMVAVPDLFVSIDDARDKYDEVDVTYDEQLGYPRRIFEDRIGNAIDDEVTFVVSDFEQLG